MESVWYAIESESGWMISSDPQTGRYTRDKNSALAFLTPGEAEQFMFANFPEGHHIRPLSFPREPTVISKRPSPEEIIRVREWYNDSRENAVRWLHEHPSECWTAFVLGAIHGAEAECRDRGTPFDPGALASRLGGFFEMVGDGSQPVVSDQQLMASIFDPVLGREIEDIHKLHGAEEPPPVNLHLHPRENWEELLNYPLEWAPALRSYIAGHDEPFTTAEIDALCDAMDDFYHVTEPYTVTIIGKVPCLIKT